MPQYAVISYGSIVDAERFADCFKWLLIKDKHKNVIGSILLPHQNQFVSIIIEWLRRNSG